MSDPNGVTKFAQRIKAQYGVSGTAFFVGNLNAYPSGGRAGADNSSNGLSELQPFATVDFAINQCIAARGDAVFLLPGHGETVTTTIEMDTAGVQLIGLSLGALKPTITPNGAIDALTVSATGCSVQNIEFAKPVTDAQTSDINIDATNCLVKDTTHHGSDTALNKVDIITLTANADGSVIDGATIYNNLVEVVGGIKLEGACGQVTIKNCFFFDSIGFTNGAIYDAATATELNIQNNVFMNAKAATVVMEFGNNSTGICNNNRVVGRHTTIASNVTPGTGMNFFENYVVEEAGLNGLYIPAQDAD